MGEGCCTPQIPLHLSDHDPLSAEDSCFQELQSLLPFQPSGLAVLFPCPKPLTRQKMWTLAQESAGNTWTFESPVSRLQMTLYMLTSLFSSVLNCVS